MCTALPYDLKHDSAQIPLLFVTADDLKRDLPQKMLKIVSIPKGSAALPILQPLHDHADIHGQGFHLAKGGF